MECNNFMEIYFRLGRAYQMNTIFGVNKLASESFHFTHVQWFLTCAPALINYY